MPTPLNRVPIRIARGTLANLTASLASLEEGEICYSKDTKELYVVVGGTLQPAGVDIFSATLNSLNDVNVAAIQTPSNGRALIFQNNEWVAGPVIGGTTTGTPIPYSINNFSDVDTVTNPPEILDVLVWNGTNWVPDDVRLKNTPPATATSSGVAGQIVYDSGFLYVCTATNTWRRTSITSW